MVSLLLTSFYSIWLYASYLRLETYGVLALALTFMMYMPWLDGGFRTVLSRAILAAEDPEKRFELLQFGQRIYTFLSILIILGNLLLMVVYGLTPSTKQEGISIFFFLFLGIANGLQAAALIQWGVFVGAQRQSGLFILQALGAWLSVNVLAWSFARGWNIWSIPIANLVTFAVTYPLSLRWIKKSFPKLKIFDWTITPQFKENFRKYKTEAWFCFRSQITTVVLYSSDILIIGYFCPKGEVAVYYMIIRLIGMLRSLLQTGGEVGWPFLAQRGGAKEDVALPWFGLHGWIYGAVAGALTVVTIPFCAWFMGPEWTVPHALLWAVVLRFMIVGLGSSATYLLYAVAAFRPISKSLETELVLGLILGTVGAYFWGVIGVAVGFLAATIGGTLLPVFLAFARSASVPLWRILGRVWSRTILGFLGSYFTASILLRVWTAGIYTPAIGAVAVGASLLLALGLAISRSGIPTNFETRQLRQLLQKV